MSLRHKYESMIAQSNRKIVNYREREPLSYTLQEMRDRMTNEEKLIAEGLFDEVHISSCVQYELKEHNRPGSWIDDMIIKETCNELVNRFWFSTLTLTAYLDEEKKNKCNT